MDRGIEQPFASTLRVLAVSGVLGDIGDQTYVENALAIVGGIKAPIEVEIGASQVQPHLFGHLFQGYFINAEIRYMESQPLERGVDCSPEPFPLQSVTCRLNSKYNYFICPQSIESIYIVPRKPFVWIMP